LTELEKMLLTNNKEFFRKLLEKYNILPFTNWNNFKISHIGSSRDREIIFDEIGRNIDEKVCGLYIYVRNGKIFYLGEGSLRERLRTHYHESYSKDKRFLKKHREFFSKNLGEFKIYYTIYDDKKIRQLLESLLTFILQPVFIGDID